MVKNIKCRPPYWCMEDNSQLPACTKMQELRQFHQMTWKGHMPSCRHITNVAYTDIDYPSTYFKNRLSGNNSSEHFYVTVHFRKSIFREIKLVRSFNEQTLTGNIGGYVGVCLGYTFLQLPTLIHSFYARCSRCLSSNNA